MQNKFLLTPKAEIKDPLGYFTHTQPSHLGLGLTGPPLVWRSRLERTHALCQGETVRLVPHAILVQ